jgi:hypothetical protein
MIFFPLEHAARRAPLLHLPRSLPGTAVTTNFSSRTLKIIAAPLERQDRSGSGRLRLSVIYRGAGKKPRDRLSTAQHCGGARDAGRDESWLKAPSTIGIRFARARPRAYRALENPVEPDSGAGPYANGVLSRRDQRRSESRQRRNRSRMWRRTENDGASSARDRDRGVGEGRGGEEAEARHGRFARRRRSREGVRDDR